MQGTAVDVGAHAFCGSGQVCGQRDGGQSLVESGVEEERQRHAVRACRRRQHAVHGGLEVTTGRHFEEFTDVDDEVSRNRIDIEPLAVTFDLESAAAGFGVQQGERTDVLVAADALARDGPVVPWVPGDLEERIGIGERVVEESGWGAQ